MARACAAAVLASLAMRAGAETPVAIEAPIDVAAPSPRLPAAPAPHAAPAAPVRRPPKPLVPVSIESRWSDSPPPPVAGDALVFADSRGERVRVAVEARLRDAAVHSRRLGVAGTLDTTLFPELAEDAWLSEERSDAAESVITSAIETACDVAFFGGKTRTQGLVVRPTVAVRDHGVSIDATPSWAYRVTSARGGFRLELPFIPTSAVRLHAYRELRGTNRLGQRVGAGLSLDPIDDSVRAGFSFEF